MRDVEALRSKTCLLLENKKQNTFISENNLESMRVPWIHKEKGFWNPLEKNKQKSEFLLISIILKNFYRLKGLFKGFVVNNS